MDRPGSFLLRDPERLPDHCRDHLRRDDLPGKLGERLHRGDHIDHLEPGLPGRKYPFLSGDHHHRHGAEERVCRTRRKIQGARPERRQADARFACQTAIGRGHECGRLLMPCQHELNGRFADGLDNIEIFFAWDTEDPVDTLVFECGHQEI